MHCITYSVNQLYARALLQSAERQRLALPAELEQAVRAHQRVPLELQDRLWETYCVASADPLAGLRLGLTLQVGHLDSAGLLLITCETLGEALDHLVEVAPVVGEGGDFVLGREADQVVLSYRPHMAVRQAERVEAVLASLLSLGGWATGGSFQPTTIRVAHAPLAPLADYRALIDCPLRFNAADNALLFHASQLEQPLIQANSALRDHLRQLADRTLAELGQNSLSAQVQRLVRAHPRWGKERIAELLEVSGRHLNRRLADEGSSFKLVRDATLHRLAAEKLRSKDSLADIAEALGFSDESAFAKAFRRWAGISPAQFRRQAAQAGVES